MGKHSAPESPGFWRAVIIAGFRYLVVVLALAAIGFGIYRFVFADPEPTENAADLDGPAASPEAASSPSPADVVGQGEEVQVLNGTAVAEKLTQAVQKLTSNGFVVVETGQAASMYQMTTVFYQQDQQPLAQNVASLLAAGVVEPATENLDPAIPVTVVVGDDYSG